MHSAKSVALYDFNFPGKNQYFTEQTWLVSRLVTKVWSAAKKKQEKQWNSAWLWLARDMMNGFVWNIAMHNWLRYGECSWSDGFVAEVNSVIPLQGNTRLQTFNIKMILTISNTIWIFVSVATLGCLQVIEGHECNKNPIGKSCCVLFVVFRFLWARSSIFQSFSPQFVFSFFSFSAFNVQSSFQFVLNVWCSL